MIEYEYSQSEKWTLMVVIATIAATAIVAALQYPFLLPVHIGCALTILWLVRHPMALRGWAYRKRARPRRSARPNMTYETVDELWEVI